MPFVDFTNPFYSITAIVLFVLCTYLAKNNKSNTVTCIMLLGFLAILVGHTIELSLARESIDVSLVSKNIVIDEAFTLASYMAFLWTDKIQIDDRKKKKGKKKKKDPTIKDGLDFLWKEV